jgi:hypothetical protein
MAEQLTAWTADLCVALGLEFDDLGSEAVRQAVLDLARDAAHGVARPAAPLTTFLVGYAAGRQGGGAGSVAAFAEQAARLARDRRAADHGDNPGDGGNQPTKSSPA